MFLDESLHSYMLFNVLAYYHEFLHSRDVERGGRGDNCPLPPPVFGRSVNPFLTMGTDYAHPITNAPPLHSGDLSLVPK